MSQYLIVKPKIVLLDWNNTIVATHNLFSSVLSVVINKLNLDPKILQSDIYKSTRHMSVKDSFPLIFGKQWMQIWTEYQKCYGKVVNQHDSIIMLPGAKDFLKYLYDDNIFLGVVSNKNHDLLIYEIGLLEITHLFSSIVGSGKALADKPSALHAMHAIDEITTNNKVSVMNMESDCWFIGDSDVDMSCSINAKCLPVLINSGDEALLLKKYLVNENVPHIAITSFDELLIKYKAC